jgi:hypothetical protein
MMKNNGTWLVLEGDWGGQIYLTVPSHLVGEGARVDELLEKLDAFAWDCNEGDGRSVYLYEPEADELAFADDGSTVGTTGYRFMDRLWIHPEFKDGTWTTLAKQLLLLA